MTLYSYDKHGNFIGKLDLPLKECGDCIVGAYNLFHHPNGKQTLRYARIQNGLVVYAACSWTTKDYESVSECPWFLKVQRALSTGHIVKTDSLTGLLNVT